MSYTAECRCFLRLLFLLLILRINLQLSCLRSGFIPSQEPIVNKTKWNVSSGHHIHQNLALLHFQCYWSSTFTSPSSLNTSSTLFFVFIKISQCCTFEMNFIFRTKLKQNDVFALKIQQRHAGTWILEVNSKEIKKNKQKTDKQVKKKYYVGFNKIISIRSDIKFYKQLKFVHIEFSSFLRQRIKSIM